MRRQLLPAVRMFLVMTLVLGIAYPLAMTALSQVAFPDQADGSLVTVDGEVVGSRLVGQEFTGPGWFHSRPSASGAGTSGSMVAETYADGNEVAGPEGEPVLVPVDVDDVADDASGSSNLGPTNPDLIASVTERADAYREDNGLPTDTEVPVDAVTSSGSGVDPHISVANARLQGPRVAEERDLPVDQILTLVDDHTTSRSLGVLGEPGVNVLELNLALDRLALDRVALEDDADADAG